MEQRPFRCGSEVCPSDPHPTYREPATWIPFFLTGLLLLSAGIFWTHTGKLLYEQLRNRNVITDQSSMTGARIIEPSLSTIFTPEVLHWREDIMRWSQEYNLDPNPVSYTHLTLPTN